MKAIKDMWLIQIEITNGFVGHHKKTYFIDLEMIEKAIDSLEGFEGGIGIMGGEPAFHPKFVEICKLLQKKVPPEKRYLWTTGYKWEE
ncbi:MAG TPA: 4Fe-4S cluster-binding domain-containing protein [Candidatus Omnitrophica bacterium]|nr:4Fe-4S cluster-binding domain-containing protein [Candidatus Omnitrophota bacterium]